MCTASSGPRSCMCVFVCVRVCMHMRVCIYVYVHVCACICVCVCWFVNMCSFACGGRGYKLGCLLNNTPRLSIQTTICYCSMCAALHAPLCVLLCMHLYVYCSARTSMLCVLLCTHLYVCCSACTSKCAALHAPLCVLLCTHLYEYCSARTSMCTALHAPLCVLLCMHLTPNPKCFVVVIAAHTHTDLLHLAHVMLTCLLLPCFHTV